MPLTPTSIAHRRLGNQWIDAPMRGDAAAVVERLVAVQSQDFAGAKWALGMRLRKSSETQVAQAFDEGRILRTHLLRPTWHFVLPQDIRWLLMLTGPRVQAGNAGMYRQAGLDAAALRRAEAILGKALQGGQELTREELRVALDHGGIATKAEFRLGYVLMHAELEGLICSGPRRGKQFTYALLDERAPAGRKRNRDWALAELTRRYFLSRGPATAHDFSKWSGLTVSDARRGLEMAHKHLNSETFAGREYWFGKDTKPSRGAPRAHLLSVYDEYISSYKDHALFAGEEISAGLRALGNALTGVIVMDGMAVGTWKRTIIKDEAHVRLEPFRKLTTEARHEIGQAAERCSHFHGVKAVVA